MLDAQPNATIVSVSQNDNGRACQDPAELAANRAEGTSGGALFGAINTIADALASSHPAVAVSTMAYAWSRAAPRSRMRTNVIIRFAAELANHAVPITADANAVVRDELVAWGNVSNRTFVWTYIADFANYYIPFPNYFTLSDNMRFFTEHGVSGMFSEGAYTTPGGDMAEMKNWVLAKLMQDPTLDGDELISTFLDGYYGKQAASSIQDYLQIMHRAATNSSFNVTLSYDWNAPFLTPRVVLAAAAALKAAFNATEADSPERRRVQTSSLAIYFVVLNRWLDLRRYARSHMVAGGWPIEATLKDAFDAFSAAADVTPPPRDSGHQKLFLGPKQKYYSLYEFTVQNISCGIYCAR
jgi:hypothetical protein